MDTRASLEDDTLDESAGELDDEAVDDSSDGLDENEVHAQALGQPIEFGPRKYRYLYLFKRMDAFWGGRRVWCICEIPGTEQTLFDPEELPSDELHTATQKERDVCIGFGVFVGTVTFATLAFVATSATSPAALAALAAAPFARDYLLVKAGAVGGFLGLVLAVELCPEPKPTYQSAWPGWNGQCPCDCPPCPPCPPSQPCPPCPPCPCPPPCCPPGVVCKEGEL